jgi:hypothetical protein
MSDRVPGIGVQMAASVGTLMLPRRWREEALAQVGHGAPITLAKRYVGIAPADKHAVLGIAWAAVLVDDPGIGRRALLRARWEKLADDLGDDDPRSREVVERWIDDTLAFAARQMR